MIHLADKQHCTGCSACTNSCPIKCITMVKNEDGFNYPLIDTNVCMNCGTCEQVCPVLSKKKNEDFLSQAYAAYSKDKLLRMESSSGGIFSEIARYIIERNGIVYGAAYNKQFEVYHCCIDNMNDLSKLRGAKYSESQLGDIFSDVLIRIKSGQNVLFTGTPCQVAGLRSFVKKDYKNLICVDFVCHGVPSPLAWEEYIKYRAREDSDGQMPININMRSKITGWSKYRYSTLFEYQDGHKYSCENSNNLFMKLFVGDYISRPSCSHCPFKGYNRVSDITLGDFWGIWDIDPEMDDNKGTSVILLHSSKGKQIFEEIKNEIYFKPMTLEQASKQNPSMIKSSEANINRSNILTKIRQGRFESCENIFVSASSGIISKLKNKVKRIFYRIIGLM